MDGGPGDLSKPARYKRIDEDMSNGCLGKGAYGRVYIAEDVQSGQVVAKKRQRYPSQEAARELAFAKLLSTHPSAPASQYLELRIDGDHDMTMTTIWQW